VSLRVIAGLPGAGGPRDIQRALIGAVRDGHTAMLVVPSAPEAARARARLSVAAPVGLRIATLDGVVEAEWALRGDGRRFVRNVQRDILIARALVGAGVCAKPGRGAVSLLATMAMRHTPGGPSGRADGLSAGLVAALQSYETSLFHFGLVERAEAARLLGRSNAPADFVGAVGFATLTPPQEDVLTGWSGAGADVLVALPWSDEAPATQASASLIGRLVVRGGSVVGPEGPPDDRSDELRRIATDLFSGRPARPGMGGVRLGMAQGDEAESRLIASFVQDLIDAGESPDTIAVAFADPSRHAGWLRRAFDDAGVPADWDVRYSVKEVPLGSALLRLWAFCRHGMDRGDLGAFLHSPFSGVAIDQADRADVSWRRSGILRGEALLAGAGRARSAIASCRSLAELPIGSETGKKWKCLADRLLSNAYPGAAPVLDSDGALDAAAHRAFCRVLESAVSLGDGVVSADELFTAFSDEQVSGSGASTSASLLVTSIDRVRVAERDHVIIGGLTASEFPRSGSEDRVEGDAVRGALSALGIAVDPEERVRAERLAFYLAVTSPRRSLALVRRESDDEGRALRESVFWDEFLDLYRSVGGSLSEEAGVKVDTLSLAGTDRRWGPIPRRRGVVTDERVLAELAGIGAVSPGAVEAYNACPYRWFVERRLRPEAPDATLDRMAAGRVAHEALATFYQRWVRDAPRVTEANVETAVRMAGECAAEAIARAPRPFGLEQERLLADIVPAVERLVARDATFLPGFVPAHLEWSFGLDEGDEPVDLGGVVVKGRADRIDIGPEGLVIIDYKRSRASSRAEMERNGLVQLQLYAAAASQRLQIPVAGGLYRSLAASEDRGFVLEGVEGDFKARDTLGREEVDLVIEQAVEAAREAVEGMRSGRIEPSPLQERCVYCVAAPFCPEAAR
jgi:RecB family exonuclease